MNAMAPCPQDSSLMKAWESYKKTEDFKTSLKWVTEEQRKPLMPPTDPTANGVSDFHRDQWAQGSMWAAFMAGFKAAGGQVTF